MVSSAGVVVCFVLGLFVSWLGWLVAVSAVSVVGVVGAARAVGVAGVSGAAADAAAAGVASPSLPIPHSSQTSKPPVLGRRNARSVCIRRTPAAC